MKKLFSAGLVVLLLFGGCDCDVDPYFDIQGIDVFNRSSLSLIPNDSVRQEDFYMEIAYQAKFYSVAETPNFSFIPSAMASQPCKDPGYSGTKERIEKIDIITLADFNANYPKGARINSILKFNDSTEAEFFNQQNLTGLKYWSLFLRLTEKPDSTVKQAFQVDIKLTNGEAYSSQTELITIY